MMAALLAVPLFAADVVTAAKPDNDEARTRRVRVALALAAPIAATPPNKCRTDYPAAAVEALDTGKPIVLFINTECAGRGCALSTDIIAVTLPTFDGDSPADVATPRIVVLHKVSSSDGPTLRESVQLKPDATGDEIKKAAEDAKPKAVTLDWFSLSPFDGPGVVGQCANGVCVAPAASVTTSRVAPATANTNAVVNSAPLANRPKLFGAGGSHPVRAFIGRLFGR